MKAADREGIPAAEINEEIGSVLEVIFGCHAASRWRLGRLMDRDIGQGKAGGRRLGEGVAGKWQAGLAGWEVACQFISTGTRILSDQLS
ncbi:hypothetical protein NKI38_32915 [Mesorhizobium sp. M0621]|uniref:hypothetical protein n=1 Tax=Mesorhizobium sp. M0621 TaxID=2956974 RepID=UPI0033376DEC